MGFNKYRDHPRSVMAQVLFVVWRRTLLDQVNTEEAVSLNVPKEEDFVEKLVPFVDYFGKLLFIWLRRHWALKYSKQGRIDNSFCDTNSILLFEEIEHILCIVAQEN